MNFQVGFKKYLNFMEKIQSYIHEADFRTGFSRLCYFHKPKEAYFVDRARDSHLGCRWPRWTLVILAQFGEKSYWEWG